MERQPSSLEVLYPPNQPGTRTYVPPFAPLPEKVSECEKLCGFINNILRGIGLAFLIGWGMVGLAILLILTG